MKTKEKFSPAPGREGRCCDLVFPVVSGETGIQAGIQAPQY